MRSLKVLAVVPVLAVPLLGAVPAGAATPGCQAVAAGACGSLVTPVAGGVALDVWQQHAASDTAVKVWKTSVTDPAEDWELIPVAATGLTSTYPSLELAKTLAGAVNVEYAPDGVLSGFCISIIASTERAAAALRPCDTVTAANQTYNPYQTFNKVAAADFDGTAYVYESVLTGLVLNDQRAGGPGSAVISYPLGGDGSTPQQLFEPNG